MPVSPSRVLRSQGQACMHVVAPDTAYFSRKVRHVSIPAHTADPAAACLPNVVAICFAFVANTWTGTADAAMSWPSFQHFAARFLFVHTSLALKSVYCRNKCVIADKRVECQKLFSLLPRLSAFNPEDGTEVSIPSTRLQIYV
jgi:hypothetical protein